MTDIVIRFVGRFVIVPENPRPSGAQGDCDRLHVLGINMQFNRCLNVAPHRLLLSIPRESLASGYPRADAEIVTATLDRGAVQEYLMWDLTNSLVSVVDSAAQTGVAFEFSNMWDLRGAVAPATLYPTPADTAVAFRFSMTRGTFSAIEFRPAGASRFRLAPLGGSAKDTDPVLTLADGMEATLSVDVPMLRIRGFSGGLTRTIRLIAKPTSDPAVSAPIVCSITNLCGESDAVSDQGSESAALHDVLLTPEPIAKRLVPVNERTLGPASRCSLAAVAAAPGS